MRVRCVLRARKIKMEATNVRHRNRISFANMALQSFALEKPDSSAAAEDDDEPNHAQSSPRPPPRRKDGIQHAAISFNASAPSMTVAASAAAAASSDGPLDDETRGRTDPVDGQRFSGCLFRSVACLVVALGATVVFEFALVDVGLTLQRPVLVAMQLFCFFFLFYSVASHLRSAWLDEVVFAVFCVCIAVELLLGCVVAQDPVNASSTQPLLTVLLLLAVGGVGMVLSLDVIQCALVMTGISVVRFFACSTISDLPPRLKPVLAYCSGVVGIIVARYRLLATHSASANCSDRSNKGLKESYVEAGEAALKNSQHRVKPRRISLPNLSRKNTMSPSATAESTLLMKADGLLEDLVIDPTVPRHIVRVLNAVKSLLKQSIPSLSTARRSKSIPHVSLSSGGGGMMAMHSYSDLPYTDDYANFCSNKGLHRTAQNITLNRCNSSFGIWSTTTSATGMPSLESELGRSKFPVYGDSNHFGRTAKNWTIGDDRSENNHVGTAWFGDRQNSSEKDFDETPEFPESGAETAGTKTKFSLGEDQDHQSSSERPRQHGTVPKHHIMFAESVRLEDGESRSDQKDVDISDNLGSSSLLDITELQKWDYSIFELAAKAPETLLCRVAHKIFKHLGFFESFSIPVQEFLNYFHALEMGYHDNPSAYYLTLKPPLPSILGYIAYSYEVIGGLRVPDHNRVHATDVLHAVFYMTTQPLTGFVKASPVDDYRSLETEQDIGKSSQGVETMLDGMEGCMKTNFLPLELMALYTAAAMHDYDHPGRTNAFLVTTCNPLAVLYNNRSVLESHHASSGWRLLLSNERYSWLLNLNNAQYKRFRFLVIEAILATDLARHFDILAEFNTKVNEEDAPGVDWLLEADRQMVSNMLVKMADINGPCKPADLHKQWTYRISEEFYEQGDEEEALGLTVSPYMNRNQPQLAKLQESFINHLVAPLCNSLSSAGLLPSVQAAEQDTSSTSSDSTAFDKESSLIIVCPMVQNMEENHRMWTKVIEEESLERSISTSENAACETESNAVESNIPSDEMSVKEDSDAA